MLVPCKHTPYTVRTPIPIPQLPQREAFPACIKWPQRATGGPPLTFRESATFASRLAAANVTCHIGHDNVQVFTNEEKIREIFWPKPLPSQPVAADQDAAERVACRAHAGVEHLIWAIPRPGAIVPLSSQRSAHETMRHSPRDPGGIVRRRLHVLSRHPVRPGWRCNFRQRLQTPRSAARSSPRLAPRHRRLGPACDARFHVRASFTTDPLHQARQSWRRCAFAVGLASPLHVAEAAQLILANAS